MTRFFGTKQSLAAFCPSTPCIPPSRARPQPLGLAPLLLLGHWGVALCVAEREAPRRLPPLHGLLPSL